MNSEKEKKLNTFFIFLVTGQYECKVRMHLQWAKVPKHMSKWQLGKTNLGDFSLRTRQSALLSVICHCEQ